MRDGVRRLIVAIKILSWLWIAASLVFGLINWAHSPYPPLGRLGVILIAALPGFAGLGLVWILTGYGQKDRPE